MATADYFARFGFCGPQIPDPPAADLGLVVTIPCHAEPDLLATLDALWRCARPPCGVEVIVVINSSTAAGPEVQEQNRLTQVQAREWVSLHPDPGLRVHVLHFPDLPERHAGVGLARKIAMDEALRRLAAVGREADPVVCLDADSLCDPDYLVALHEHFRRHPRTPGCSVYFEHPLAGPEAPRIYEAICRYEIHLRYYVQALQWCGLPHAFHTVGSSMAVRAKVYRDQGGMNRRQAGEDFYFLHKVIPLGHFTNLNATRVIPSPRVSHRVPFGTGRAVGEYLASNRMETYPFQAFVELRDWLLQMETWCGGSDPPQPRASIAAFLATQDFPNALEEMRRNTASLESLRRRFFRWLDGFRTLKLIHFVCDHGLGRGQVEEEVLRLQSELDVRSARPPDLAVRPLAPELLALLRERDRARDNGCRGRGTTGVWL